MMNDDAHPRELLSPYLDGELDPDERRRVAAHLEQCAECGALLDDLRTLAAGIAAEEPPLPPADLAAHIHRGVDDLDGEAKVVPIRRPLWHSPLVLSSMAAVMAGIIVTVVWLASGPPAVRQEFGIIAEKTNPPPPEAGRIPVSSATGEASSADEFAPADQDAVDEASSSIGKQERKKVRADAPAKREAVPLPESAQETMALMEQKAARAARPEAAPAPRAPSPAAPSPTEPPAIAEREQAGADDRSAAADVADAGGAAGVAELRVAADAADLDALGYVANERGEGAAPGGPPVAEPPPARSLELQKSDYRAILSEAGALTFRSGEYECVIPVISPARGNVPPSSPVDLTMEIRQIFELAAAEQSRRAATEPPPGEGAVSRALQAVSLDISFQALTYADGYGTPVWNEVVLEDAEGKAASSAAPIAVRLDRLIREHYLSLMERGCGPLPPELQTGEKPAPE